MQNCYSACLLIQQTFNYQKRAEKTEILPILNESFLTLSAGDKRTKELKYIQ